MTEEELTPFFASLHAKIAKMASKILGPSEADDIVADCFLTVLIRKNELPPDKADWERWITGIAKNKVRHEYQRRTRKHHDYRFVHDWTAPGGGPTTEDASRSVIETNRSRPWLKPHQPTHVRETVPPSGGPLVRPPKAAGAHTPQPVQLTSTRARTLRVRYHGPPGRSRSYAHHPIHDRETVRAAQRRTTSVRPRSGRRAPTQACSTHLNTRPHPTGAVPRPYGPLAAVAQATPANPRPRNGAALRRDRWYGRRRRPARTNAS